MDSIANGCSSAERLRALIAAKLKERGLSHRWAERKLKLGHRTVANILAGRTTFRLEHVDLFARLFGMSPSALLAEAEGIDTAAAQIRLGRVVQHLNAALEAAEEGPGERLRKAG